MGNKLVFYKFKKKKEKETFSKTMTITEKICQIMMMMIDNHCIDLGFNISRKKLDICNLSNKKKNKKNYLINFPLTIFKLISVHFSFNDGNRIIHLFVCVCVCVLVNLFAKKWDKNFN